MSRDDLSKRRFLKDSIGPVATPLFAKANKRVKAPSDVRSEIIPEQSAVLPGVHPSALDGLSPGSIGSNGTLTGFSASGQYTPVLSARGNDTHPEILTLCLSAEGPSGSPDYRVKALVRWGVGGASHSAIVDVLRGTQVTVVATAVDVAFSQERQTPGQPDPDTQTLVSVSLCSGARSSESPRFSTSASVVPAARFVQAVPAFASKVKLYAGASLVGCLVTFETANAVAIGSVVIASDNEAQEGYSIPGNATSVAVQNLTPGAIDVTTSFVLNL